jgi:hypothetical protein
MGVHKSNGQFIFYESNPFLCLRPASARHLSVKSFIRVPHNPKLQPTPRALPIRPPFSTPAHLACNVSSVETNKPSPQKITNLLSTTHLQMNGNQPASFQCRTEETLPTISATALAVQPPLRPVHGHALTNLHTSYPPSSQMGFAPRLQHGRSKGTLPPLSFPFSIPPFQRRPSKRPPTTRQD